MTRRASQSTLLEHDAQGQPEKGNDMDAIVDVQMTPKTKTTTVAPRGERGATLPTTGSTASGLEVMPTAAGLSMFERLALDPHANVDTVERLMALWERQGVKRAEEAFNAAMSVAQQTMRPISADASNPQTRSRYASYAKLDAALRPIYTAHGFGLSFDTADATKPDDIRVLCYVTHAAGHTRTYRVDMPCDGKGAKGGDVMTRTHATGSGISYGMRYLLKMIFNVAVGEADDDGNGATVKPKPAAVVQPVPAGFEAWRLDLQATADEGTERLKAAWEDSPVVFRSWLTLKHADSWMALKARAVKAGAR